jgi:hypothetical protein
MPVNRPQFLEDVVLQRIEFVDAQISHVGTIASKNQTRLFQQLQTVQMGERHAH